MLGLDGSRELLALEGLFWPWKAFAGSAEPDSHGSALGLPCLCGPSVTAAGGPGRLNLPPGSGRPPIGEEDMGGSRLAGAGTILRGLTPWQHAWGSRKG